MDARSEILRRIRDAQVPSQKAEREPIPPHSRPQSEIIAQFADYAAEYRAHVEFCTARDLSTAIRKRLEEKGSRRVVVPPDLDPNWVVGGLPDIGFNHATLATMDAVVTACAVAIAETGTVVLDAGAGQGRRALSLIPDHHVCIVYADQIVESVPQAVARLTESAKQGRPMTWISGPSATSDIELSRVEGVHGPRTLDILIVGESPTMSST
jgi:L-lactate dehydrogenase complex protein LldG